MGFEECYALDPKLYKVPCQTAMAGYAGLRLGHKIPQIPTEELPTASAQAAPHWEPTVLPQHR